VLSGFELKERKGENMKTKYGVMIAGLALASALGPTTFAQVNSTQASVNLNAVINETVSVSATPGTVNFDPLNPNGVTSGDSSITINSAWVLSPSRGNLNVYAYFASTTALTHASSPTFTIPSSSVQGKVGAGAFTAFTGNSPFAAGSSLTVASVAIVGNNKNSSRSDTLSLQIDTTGAGLPAGTYTGVLFVQAQAI
jgi:hypothetical protein